MQIIQFTPEQLKQLLNEVLDNKLIEIAEALKTKPKLEYLSRKETKELLGVSYVTLNNWRNKEVLEPHYIGNKLFYNKQEIEDLLSNENS